MSNNQRASDLWNKLPQEVRHQARPSTTAMQIRQIRSDQDKAKRAYQKFMGETNDHIKNLERSLADDLKELKR